MKKLMLVDSDETLCGLLAQIMESRFDDLEVVVVRSCHDALRLARAVRPDIVVIDWHLPDGSGEDLLNKVVSILPDAHVIVTSSGARSSCGEPDLPGGASTTLVKPYDLNQLLGTLTRAGALPGGRRRRCGTARFSGDPASSPESPAFEHHAVFNKLSNLLAGFRAYGTDLRAGANDAAALVRTVEVYTSRLGVTIQELRQIMSEARHQPHAGATGGTRHVHSQE